MKMKRRLERFGILRMGIALVIGLFHLTQMMRMNGSSYRPTEGGIDSHPENNVSLYVV